MYILIFFLPLLSTLFVSIFGRKLGREGTYRICIISLIIITIISILGIYEIGIQNITTRINIGKWIETESININYGFIFDPLSIGMCFTIAIISLVVFIFSKDYLSEDPYIIRYYINLSLFVLCMLILVISENLILTFVCWEGVGITSYLLINFWYTRRDSNTSAMQAVLLNRIGDWGLLIAIFQINNLWLNLDYNIIGLMSEYIPQPQNDICFINFFILLAAIAKSAQMILHTWLPSAMAAPTPISSLLHAATMVTLGVYIIIRGSVFINGISNIFLIIFFIGAITSLIAGLTGLNQFDIKKVIAYSTSSQIGYMISSCGSQEYGIAFNHLINHAFFKAFLFINAGAIIHHIKDEQDFRNIGKLIKSNPWLHFSYLIGTLSLIAFPYFSGFYSKDLILEDLAHSWSISISGRIIYYLQLLTAFITTIYCFRSYWYIFINDSSKNFFTIKEYFLFPSFFLAFPTVIAGFFLSDLLVGPGSSFWDGNSSSGIFKWNENEVEEDEILIITLIISILGISLGYIFSVSPYLFPPFNFFKDRFYFDHFYNNFFATSLLNESKFTGKYIDKGLIEEIGYKGMNKFYINNKYNTLDSGFLPNYLLFFLFGLFFFHFFL